MILWAGKRCWNTISFWNILLHTWARKGSLRKHGATTEALKPKNCNWDSTCQNVLSGGGVPSAIPRERGATRSSTICWERLQWPYQVLWLSFQIVHICSIFLTIIIWLSCNFDYTTIFSIIHYIPRIAKFCVAFRYTWS